MKFKIGDRVCFRQHGDPNETNVFGTIIDSVGALKSMIYGEFVRIRWDDGFIDGDFLESQLELVVEPNDILKEMLKSS